jgi:hypothetical protein
VFVAFSALAGFLASERVRGYKWRTERVVGRWEYTQTYMIAKREFYHGVAVVRLLEDKRCRTVRKAELGYVVNENVFIFLKYSTKARSPWRFTFVSAEVDQLNSRAASLGDVFVAFICGGDGICAVAWSEACRLLGSRAGWISARRNFKQEYRVAGPTGELGGKVPVNGWPSIAFENDS